MEGTAPTRGKFTSFWIFSLYFELFLFEKTWSATLKRLNEVNVCPFAPEDKHEFMGSFYVALA